VILFFILAIKISLQSNTVDIYYKSKPILKTIEIKGLKFKEINLEDANGIIFKPGAPRLPCIRKFIEVGENYSISYEVIYEETLKLDCPVIPNNRPVAKLPHYEEGFIFDSVIYNTDRYYPGKIINTKKVTIRGHKLILLEVFPVQYNPKKNEIIFYSIRSKVTTHNLPVTTYSQDFDAPIKDLILNYKQGEEVPECMLIITPDEYKKFIDPLAQWYREKGFVTHVATLSEVGGGDTSSVRNYIKTAYSTWQIKPSYVLLVGDVDKIAYFPGVGYDQPPTDLYYSTIDDTDFLPDLYLSRLSIGDSIQLDSLVKKILKYEQANWLDNGFTQRAYFIASSDGTYHSLAEATHKYCMSKIRNYGMECDSLFLYYGSGTPITTALNDGRSIVMYSGHGTSTSWYDPSFSVTNVHNLQNIDKVPFVGTFACLTGNYTVGECFAESWLRVGFRGAIAHLASSVVTYWGPDDTLQRYIFDAWFDSNFTTISGMINKAKLMYFLFWGDDPYGFTRGYFERYNLFGCGAVDIYTLIPESLKIITPSVCYIDTFFPTISLKVEDNAGNAVANVRICVLKDTLFTGVTDENGEVTLPNPAVSAGTLIVTASKHNYICSKSYVPVYSIITQINPDTINVGVPNTLEVSVYSNSPIQGAKLTLKGYGVYDSTFTDSTGKGKFIISPPYGEVLDLIVEYAGMQANYNVYVNGGDTLDADIVARVDSLGLVGSLVLGYPGAIDFISHSAGFKFFIKNLNVSDSTQDTLVTYEILPVEPGTLVCAIAKTGYRVYEKYIPVSVVKGFVSGEVKDTSGKPVRAKITFYHLALGDTIVCITNTLGGFTVSDSIIVGKYKITITGYPYEELDTTCMISSGSNYLTYTLEQAPPVYMTIKCKDECGIPINGRVALRFYIKDVTDKDTLILTKLDTLINGEITLHLIEYTYEAKIAPFGYIPVFDTIEFSENKYYEFVFEEAPEILLIDAHGDGNVIYDVLSESGYKVKLALLDTIDTTKLSHSSIVIYTTRNDTSPFTHQGKFNSRTIKWLINHIENGGRALFEGGEIAYYIFTNLPEFAKKLHIRNVTSTYYESDTMILSDAIMVPNRLPRKVWFTGDHFYYDYDKIQGGEETYSFIITYDSTYSALIGYIPFTYNCPIFEVLSVNLFALDSTIAMDLLENAIYRLMQEPPIKYGKLTITSEDTFTLEITGKIVHKLITAYDKTTLELPQDNYEIIFTTKRSLIIDTINLTDSLEKYCNSFGGEVLYTLEDGVDEYTGDWQFGVPNYELYGGAKNSSIWGTNLYGNYSDNTNSELILREVSIKPFGKVYLIFKQWLDIPDRSDYGKILASCDGYNWEEVTPLTGYSTEDGFTGCERIWSRVIVPLPVGTNLQIKFVFETNSTVNGAGWYLDDIKIIGVYDNDRLPNTYKLQNVYPNPARSIVKLEYWLRKSAEVKIKFYDIAGRCVKEIDVGNVFAGKKVTQVSLKDLPAGVYFVSIQIKNNEINKKFTNKFIHIK